MNILGLIPARGGSKGIPRKNIYKIGDKPLIAYTIEEALKAKEKKVLDDVVVTTDDNEIADISRCYGATVPFLRPSEFSSDKSKSVDCMLHAVNFFEKKGMKYDAVMLLQPTSPLRVADDIINSVSMYEKNQRESLISCYLEESISTFNSYYIRNGETIPLNENHNKGIRRQDLEPLYVRNGAIFITDVEYMKKTRLVIGDRPLIYVMPVERSINIDTISDIHKTEWMINNENCRFL